MRRVTKENLIAQIDQLRKVKDEQGKLSMNGEYTLQAYEMLLTTMDSGAVFTLEVARADYKEQKLGNHFGFITLDTARKLEEGKYQLYLHAQPAPVTEREPIAWLNDAYLARGVVDGEAGSEDAGPGYIPVYREAQPAPVVPDEMADPDESQYGGDYDEDYQAECAYVEGWNACRAVMLNQK